MKARFKIHLCTFHWDRQKGVWKMGLSWENGSISCCRVFLLVLALAGWNYWVKWVPGAWLWRTSWEVPGGRPRNCLLGCGYVGAPFFCRSGSSPVSVRQWFCLRHANDHPLSELFCGFGFLLPNTNGISVSPLIPVLLLHLAQLNLENGVQYRMAARELAVGLRWAGQAAVDRGISDPYSREDKAILVCNQKSYI